MITLSSIIILFMLWRTVKYWQSQIKNIPYYKLNHADTDEAIGLLTTGIIVIILFVTIIKLIITYLP